MGSAWAWVGSPEHFFGLEWHLDSENATHWNISGLAPALWSLWLYGLISDHRLTIPPGKAWPLATWVIMSSLWGLNHQSRVIKRKIFLPVWGGSDLRPRVECKHKASSSSKRTWSDCHKEYGYLDRHCCHPTRSGRQKDRLVQVGGWD